MVPSVTSVVTGVLSSLKAPRSLVIIAKGWCSSVWVAVLLGLPVTCVYMEPSLSAVFHSLLAAWGVLVKSLEDLATVYFPDTITLVASGPISFVQDEWGRHLRRVSSVIWIVEESFIGKSPQSIRRSCRNAERACSVLGLVPLRFPHRLYGGSTDAVHVIGFSSSFQPQQIAPPSNVVRSLRHFWKPAEPLPRPVSFIATPSAIGGDFDRPVSLKAGVYRVDGLLPVSAPLCLVCGPSVFYPDKSVQRRLTRTELLAVFDVPSVLHPVILDSFTWNSSRPPVFSSSISPVVLTAVFRQLWSENGGVQQLPVADFLGSSAPSSVIDALPPSDDSKDVCVVEKHSADKAGVLGDSEKGACVVGALAEGARELGSSEKGACVLGDGDTERDDALSEAEEVVDLGIVLPPNPSPSNEVCDMSEASSASVPSLVTSTSAPSLLTYKSFDTSSGEDSFMPRRRKKKCEPYNTDVDWEFLDDVSVSVDTMETEDSSVSSIEAEYQMPSPTFDGLPSPSLSEVGSEASSVASADTLVTSPSRIVVVPENTLNMVKDQAIGKKAVKADDAEVPVHMWNDRINLGPNGELIDKDVFLTDLRDVGHRLFRRALFVDCIDYLDSEFGPEWRRLSVQRTTSSSALIKRVCLEVDAVKNILWHASETNWFEYFSGSRLHHFRFPKRYRKEARDGVKIYFETAGPDTKQRQPDIKPDMVDMVRAKIFKVIRRRYLVKVRTGMDIKSLIKFFAVPKGESDIRLVYDATASGLNAAVWAPPFFLPTIDSLTRSLEDTSWMADRDVGDMFLNFPLHKAARPYAGVDIKPILKPEDTDQHRWYQWVRNAMGFSPSPHNSVKMSLVVEEIIKGDRFDPRNPFQWELVRLNLPGSKSYDPTQPWIKKVRADGQSASELFTFVDDERVAGATADNGWEASHAVASKQAYVGVQDAARKADVCTQQARAWAGAVVHVIPGKGVCVLTSDEKWSKTKGIIAKWLDRLEGGETILDHKELLSDRGFLVYVTRAYPPMIPYLKGFHLTAEMWRGNRDVDGWKLPPQKLKEQMCDLAGGEVVETDEDEAVMRYVVRKQFDVESPHAPPDGKTTPAPRLIEDLKALKRLTSPPSPPLRIVRPKRLAHVFYGFGDASGKGRGSTIQGYRTVDGNHGGENSATELIYRVGVWGADVEAESSNYRELANLVEDTEAEATAGRLVESELFLFTDNSTAESAFYKGSSSSKKLHELVLRLQKLSLEFSIILHVIHVSGTRMIAQGTDGCSRGVLMEGVMAGQGMLSFVDLDKSACERSSSLLPWIRSWCGYPNMEPLTPAEWFVEGHGIIGGDRDKRGVWIPNHEEGGNMHLWAPAPAIADAMLEELLKARHKRTDTWHIVVIPRLMAPKWRRLFHKVVDLHFAVDPGNAFWPSDMFEPLFVGIVFPFIRHRPWQLKRAPLMVGMGRDLRQMCKEGDFAPGCLLRKLLRLPRRLDRLSPSVARGVLHMPGEDSVSHGQP